MIYWYALLAILIIALLYMRFEATFLKVERIRFSKDKNALKVVQLSDIHINKLKVSQERITEVLSQENPDILILSGDYIEEPKDIPDFLKFLASIKGHKNTYLCLGNHDYEAFKDDPEGLSEYIRTLENHGFKILHNETVCFEKNHKKYNITGIADIRYNHHDIEKALSTCCPDARLTLAFSHNPDIVLQIPRNKVDYLLTGHFHGGQIWAPFNLEFKLMRREKLCKMGVRKGLHKINGINLYVNRGLGNVVVPLRFMSRPEITVFYLP